MGKGLFVAWIVVSLIWLWIALIIANSFPLIDGGATQGCVGEVGGEGGSFGGVNAEEECGDGGRDCGGESKEIRRGELNAKP